LKIAKTSYRIASDDQGYCIVINCSDNDGTVPIIKVVSNRSA